ncbi:hypothetical protein GC163_05560 [bacterium]|nr:hypothetical protein [bacterium]
MDARHELLLSPDAAALHRAVMERCCQALQQERSQTSLGQLLWIVPTVRARRQWSRQLACSEPSVCLSPPLTTFDDFAEQILRVAGHPATKISSTVRRLLLRRITTELWNAKELVHFGSVAQTTGFLDVVSGFISEVKRDEIWPEQFREIAEQSPQVTQRDRELGLIYQRYQDLLLQHNWYDAEGLYWLARTELANSSAPGLQSWSWVGVSGFADLTRTQYEILQMLAERSPSLVVTLPGGADDDRPDVFAKSQVAESTLRNMLPRLKTESVAPIPLGPPARQILCRSLFKNPRITERQSHAAGLELVACLGNESEIHAVALRIKQLLKQGVRPQEIAIGLRQFNEQGRRWEAELTEAGLPVWCELGQPLRETSLIKLLLAVLQNELENWRFDRLTAVLGSSIVQPQQYPGDFRHDVRATDCVLRGLRLSEGRHEIVTAVERAASRFTAHPRSIDDDDPDLPAEQTVTPEQYQAARRCLSWYHRLTESFHRSHTLPDWIAILNETLLQLGLVTSSSADDPQRARLTEIWENWQRRLRDAAAAELQAWPTPARWSVEDLVPELRDYLLQERLDPSPEPAGAIRLLSLEQLRHLETPHLFLVSLTEDSFPRRHLDDCLFTDAERRHFVNLGIPLRHALQRQQEELQFFATLVTTATRQLVCTYPAVDARGQPQFPSPYLAALQLLWTEEVLPVHHAGQLDPVPTAETAVTPADARLLAIHQALHGEAGWLRTLSSTFDRPALTGQLWAAAEMAEHRFATSGFTHYEGRLQSAGNLTSLSRQFHFEHQFSATELEAYATCPFRFWLEHVLNVEPVPAIESGTNHLRRGVIVHDVLSRLVDQFRPDFVATELTQRFTELVRQQLELEPSQSELDDALLRIESQLLGEWSEEYAQQLQTYVDQLTESWDVTAAWSTIPEIPFGSLPGQDHAAAPAHPPLTIGEGNRRVLLRGRIDRLDLGKHSGQPVFTIIDYKTGRQIGLKEDDLQAGRRLQLVLYAVAARRLGIVPAQALPFQPGYWYLKERGFRSALPGRANAKFQLIEESVWLALEQIVDETIPQLVAGMRAGEFVVDNADKDCTGHCAFHTVCRVNQIRPIAEKRVKLRRNFAAESATASELRPESAEKPVKSPRRRASKKSTGGDPS